MTIDYDELCPITQEQIAKLEAQEGHLEEYQDNAVTNLKSVSGRPLDVSELTPTSLIEVNGITGQVQHMIEAGLADESIYSGSYDDYKASSEEPDEPEAEQEVELHVDHDTLTTAQQIEDALGSANTIDSVTAVLSGEDVNTELLNELSEAYGVTASEAKRELQDFTQGLYNEFADYAEAQLEVADVDHLAEWVAYAANQNPKVMSLYHQAVTGALSGDFSYSHELVQEYRKFYRMF